MNQEEIDMTKCNWCIVPGKFKASGMDHMVENATPLSSAPPSGIPDFLVAMERAQRGDVKLEPKLVTLPTNMLENGMSRST